MTMAMAPWGANNGGTCAPFVMPGRCIPRCVKPRGSQVPKGPLHAAHPRVPRSAPATIPCAFFDANVCYGFSNFYRQSFATANAKGMGHYCAAPAALLRTRGGIKSK